MGQTTTMQAVCEELPGQTTTEDVIYEELYKDIKGNRHGLVDTMIKKLGRKFLQSPDPKNTSFSRKYPRYLVLCALGSGEGHPFFNELRNALLEIGIEFSSFDLLYMFIAAKYWRYEPPHKNNFILELNASPEFEKLSEFTFTLQIEELFKGFSNYLGYPDGHSHLNKVSIHGRRTGTIKINYFFGNTLEFKQLDSTYQYFKYEEIMYPHGMPVAGLEHNPTDPNLYVRSFVSPLWLCLRTFRKKSSETVFYGGKNITIEENSNTENTCYFVKKMEKISERIKCWEGHGFLIQFSVVSPENAASLVEQGYLPFL